MLKIKRNKSTLPKLFYTKDGIYSLRVARVLFHLFIWRANFLSVIFPQDPFKPLLYHIHSLLALKSTTLIGRTWFVIVISPAGLFFKSSPLHHASLFMYCDHPELPAVIPQFFSGWKESHKVPQALEKVIFKVRWHSETIRRITYLWIRQPELTELHNEAIQNHFAIIFCFLSGKFSLDVVAETGWKLFRDKRIHVKVHSIDRFRSHREFPINNNACVIYALFAELFIRLDTEKPTWSLSCLLCSYQLEYDLRISIILKFEKVKARMYWLNVVSGFHPDLKWIKDFERPQGMEKHLYIRHGLRHYQFSHFPVPTDNITRNVFHSILSGWWSCKCLIAWWCIPIPTSAPHSILFIHNMRTELVNGQTLSNRMWPAS